MLLLQIYFKHLIKINRYNNLSKIIISNIYMHFPKYNFMFNLIKFLLKDWYEKENLQY